MVEYLPSRCEALSSNSSVYEYVHTHIHRVINFPKGVSIPYLPIVKWLSLLKLFYFSKWHFHNLYCHFNSLEKILVKRKAILSKTSLNWTVASASPLFSLWNLPSNTRSMLQTPRLKSAFLFLQCVPSSSWKWTEHDSNEFPSILILKISQWHLL
jgi:hypothetical protein